MAKDAKGELKSMSYLSILGLNSSAPSLSSVGCTVQEGAKINSRQIRQSLGRCSHPEQQGW